MGANATDYDDIELQKLMDFNPDVCFVCLGGNDIRPDSDPSDLVKKILIVTDKMKESGVKKIYVSEISTRGNAPVICNHCLPTYGDGRGQQLFTK